MQHFNNIRQLSMNWISQSNVQFWRKGLARGHLRTVYYKNRAEMTLSGKRCGSGPWSWKFSVNSQFHLWGTKEGGTRRGGDISSCRCVREPDRGTSGRINRRITGNENPKSWAVKGRPANQRPKQRWKTKEYSGIDDVSTLKSIPGKYQSKPGPGFSFSI